MISLVSYYNWKEQTFLPLLCHFYLCVINFNVFVGIRRQYILIPQGYRYHCTGTVDNGLNILYMNNPSHLTLMRTIQVKIVTHCCTLTTKQQHFLSWGFQLMSLNTSLTGNTNICKYQSDLEYIYTYGFILRGTRPCTMQPVSELVVFKDLLLQLDII